MKWMMMEESNYDYGYGLKVASRQSAVGWDGMWRLLCFLDSMPSSLGFLHFLVNSRYSVGV
jgi:hypothetical protein